MDKFSFAGFDWPRRVATLPKGTPYARLQARRFDPHSRAIRPEQPGVAT